jgi:hypothetical protein
MLNYTGMKLKSRPPPKKSAYFTHPDFSAAKLENSAQITRVNAVINYICAGMDVLLITTTLMDNHYTATIFFKFYSLIIRYYNIAILFGPPWAILIRSVFSYAY